MTGNVVFLGFAVADAKDFSIPASLFAIAAFLAGALAGGRLASIRGHHRGQLLAIATYVQIALLALAMGLQKATARPLGVPDLTTTVLTLTLTGIAADSTLAGGTNPNPGRRLVGTATMFLGAAIGPVLIFHVSVNAVLALALALLVLNGIVAYRQSSSSAAWTARV